MVKEGLPHNVEVIKSHGVFAGHERLLASGVRHDIDTEIDRNLELNCLDVRTEFLMVRSGAMKMTIGLSRKYKVSVREGIMVIPKWHVVQCA